MAPDDGLTGGDAHHPIGSMTRAQALRAITYHVAAGDMAMATRVYCENRISRRAFDEAVIKGQQLAAVTAADRAQVIEPEDCDAEGRCWWFVPASVLPNGTCPSWCLAPAESPRSWFTHWLPANALPLPSGEAEGGHHPIGSMSRNPEHDRQDAIETACHNAMRAMHDQATIAHRDGRSPEACLILAAALNQLVLQDITGEQLADCVMHLTRQASPRRGDS